MEPSPDRLGLTPDNRYYSLPDLEGRKVLEIGCNTGLLARHIARNLKPRKYLGIDLWLAGKPTDELRGHWRSGNIERRQTLPFEQKWDVVICFDVLYHLLSPLEALRNLYLLTEECLVLGTAVLAQGEGPFVRFEPGLGGDATNFFFPTEECLTKMLQWAGFKQLDRRYHFAETQFKGLIDRVCYHCRK